MSLRIFGTIEKVEALDDGTIKVHGIASTESIDEQGEIVTAAAMRSALPDYMSFPALRSMHQLDAAGTTLEAEVGEDNATRIVAHVVDPIAVLKCKKNVFRGFSIGGRITQREAGNPKRITGLVLNEISLVDRPANPDSIFDVWKATTKDGLEDMPDAKLATIADTPAGEALKALAEPVQVWSCGIGDHNHTAKAEAAACIEKRATHGAPAAEDELRKAEAELNSGDVIVEQWSSDLMRRQPPPPIMQPEEPAAGGFFNDRDAVAKADKPKGDYGSVEYADTGHQADKKPRYPIDDAEHIRAAWNYISKPKNAGKYSSEDLASIKAKIIAAWKDKIDPDGPPSAQSSKKAAQDFIKSLIADEAGEKGIVLMSKMTKGQEAGHQMGLDVAAMAAKRAMGHATKKSDKKCAANFCKSVLDAGATDLGAGDREMLTDGNPVKGAAEATNHATQDTGRNAETAVPNPTGASPASPYPGSAKAGGVSEVLAIKTAAVSAIIDGQLSEIAKSAAASAMTPYQKLMMIAHDAVKGITNGATCKAGGAKPDHISRSDMDDLDTAHYHFTKGRGLKCDMAAMAAKVAAGDSAAADTEDEDEVAKTGEAEDLSKLELPVALAKALQEQNDRMMSQFAELHAETVKTVSGLAETVGATRQRVEDIAKQEWPPLTIAKGTVITEKGGADSNGPSAEEMAAAIAKMGPEERQMTTLKGTFLNGPDVALTERFGGRIVR